MTKETKPDLNNPEATRDTTTTRKRVKIALPEATSEDQFKRSKPNEGSKLIEHPRWHTQSYLLFLALRQHPERTLPRGQLIKAALELDRKFSAQLGLPKLYRGKTPANSASAMLTRNEDRYFISFKPEGSPSMHFRLAYEPGNVDTAVTEYEKWSKKLVEHDWPYCFGVPKVSASTNHYHTPVSETDTHEQEKQRGESVEDTSTKDQLERASSGDSVDERAAIINITKAIEESAMKMPSSLPAQTNPLENINDKTAHSPLLTQSIKENENIEPQYTLDQLDLTNVPNSWRDILTIAPSDIANAGNGLFATRTLPYNTPIGFYFGVPMTEDEFDSLKDRVGRSSEYSIMYRRTVLDATDDQGEPVIDQSSPRFCPFHFMNETSEEKDASVAFVEGVVVNQVICWTRKEIQPGEELLAWYGADVNRYWQHQEQEKRKQRGHDS